VRRRRDQQGLGAHAADLAVGTASRLAGTPLAARGLAVEAAWIATHLAFYPIGMLSDRLREPTDRYTTASMPPLHRALLARDVTAPATPILLVHGWIDNRSIFTRLRRSLARRGFGRVVTVNLPLFPADVAAAAHTLATAVDTLCEQTGHPRIHVVAHSLGGLVARYYVQKMDGDERIHTLVTLGTPHAGTRVARLMPAVVPYPLLAQMRPGSKVLTELAAPAPGCKTRFVCFAGDLDGLVSPPSSALLRHPDLDVRNVLVRGVGHHSLTFNGRVVHEIATTLSVLGPPVSAVDVDAS
jgi:triacylglycerol lipase